MKFKKLYEANNCWNDWRFQFHWHKLEWVNPKYNPKRVKTFSVASKTFYIDKNDRTANSVGYSKLKELNINYFFKRKHMNEVMEAELAEMYSRPENMVVSEDASVDETIPIDLRK